MSVPQAAAVQPVPERVQVTPLLAESLRTEAVSRAGVEDWTVRDGGLTETEIGSGGAAVTVMAAADDLVASATEVATRESVAGAGTDAGALYVTEVRVMFVNVPQLAAEQPEPERVQVTPLLAGSFWTVAENGVDCETWTDELGGLTATEIAGGAALMVIVEEADLAEFETDVAINETVEEVGTVPGAV